MFKSHGLDLIQNTGSSTLAVWLTAHPRKITKLSLSFSFALCKMRCCKTNWDEACKILSLVPGIQWVAYIEEGIWPGFPNASLLLFPAHHSPAKRDKAYFLGHNGAPCSVVDTSCLVKDKDRQETVAKSERERERRGEEGGKGRETEYPLDYLKK